MNVYKRFGVDSAVVLSSIALAFAIYYTFLYAEYLMVKHMMHVNAYSPHEIAAAFLGFVFTILLLLIYFMLIRPINASTVGEEK